MTFAEKIAAMNGQKAVVTKVLVANLPSTAELWDKTDEQQHAENVLVVAVDARQKKDGTGAIFNLTLADGRQMIANEACTTGAARIVKIPAGVHTAIWAGTAYSTTEVNVSTEDRFKVLSANGMITLDMELAAKLRVGILTKAKV